MATTVICTHCGFARDRGVRPDWCAVCSPWPEQAREAQRRAEDAQARIDAAIQRAAGDEDGEDAPPPRRESVPRPRIHDAIWLIGPNPRFLPHLFQPLAPASCCGKVRYTRQYTPAGPGRRGCRQCAFAAGFVASITEVVTT